MTTTLTTTELQAIEEAIASGVTKVTYNGRTVEYDSMAGLVARRTFIKDQIDGTNKSRRTVGQFTKGLEL